MKEELIEENLHRSLLFKDFSLEEIAVFRRMSTLKIVSEGEYVYHQGTQSDQLYVIALGEAELVFELEDGTSSVVGRIGTGGHFGETGILTSKARTVSVCALFDLVLICFSEEDFKNKLLTDERIHRQIDTSLAERLQVAFLDQAEMFGDQVGRREMNSAEKIVLFSGRATSSVKLERLQISQSQQKITAARIEKNQAEINRIAANNKPFFLNGEEGTGRSIITKQIHLQSSRRGSPFREIDLREYSSTLALEKKLFGGAQNADPFYKTSQTGFFEQAYGGTLIFNHVQLMNKDLQKQLIKVITSSVFTYHGSNENQAIQSRLVFVSSYSLESLRASGKLIPEMLELFEQQNFTVPALRDHKKDLPRLVDYYLECFSKEYCKKVDMVSVETLGILMNYDWPGNLTELSTVIRRAVMLAKTNEIRSDQILLGLPKTEGKWEFNLLRLPIVNKFLKSGKYPKVPQAIVGVIISLVVLTLFFGPRSFEENAGLTLSWSIGWPLMFFSFFFLARTWCSVCTLSMPGRILQNVFKPTRKTPRFIVNYSGWIMGVLCVLVFWVEIVWNSYENPILTGCIILTITVGSIISSIFFTRRAWCRYLCPLGAVNAIFAMPSIIELRSNRHVCLNKCQKVACFGGGAEISGCPMFRHPYLVDNNRDCIFCAECIKNCDNSSVQLNLRLAPQELWMLQSPRLADSLLVVALGAIFFPFALHTSFSERVSSLLAQISLVGWHIPYSLGASILFFALIAFFIMVYYGVVALQSRYAGIDFKKLLPLLGYGMIPLILGSYLAIHLDFFVKGAGNLIPQAQQIFGFEASYENRRIMSQDSTIILQIISILGGLLASMYATYRITERLLIQDVVCTKTLTIPFSFLLILTGFYLYML